MGHTMITDAMIDAAAEALAIVWPQRSPETCVIGLPIETRRQIKAIAEEMLIAAERFNGMETRGNPFYKSKELP